MRNVFVFYKDNTYHIIDKATDTLFYKIDDVLLFNATYKRYKKTKGWHGVLNEEINQRLVTMLQQPFRDLHYTPQMYYPRNQWDEAVKKVTYLRLREGKETYRGQEHMGSPAAFNTTWVSEIQTDEYITLMNTITTRPRLGTATWVLTNALPTTGETNE